MTLYRPFEIVRKLIQGHKKASYNMGNSSNDISVNIGKYAPLTKSSIDQRHFCDANNQHTSENNGSFLKGSTLKISKKDSYNIGNLSNDSLINTGKYAPLDNWIDQRPFFDINNQYTSENSGSFPSRSYSFTYIPSLGTPSVCTQPQKNDYDYVVIEDEQCNILGEQIKILLQNYSRDLPNISLKEYSYYVNDYTIQSIGEQVKTDTV